MTTSPTFDTARARVEAGDFSFDAVSAMCSAHADALVAHSPAAIAAVFERVGREVPAPERCERLSVALAANNGNAEALAVRLAVSAWGPSRPMSAGPDTLRSDATAYALALREAADPAVHAARLLDEAADAERLATVEDGEAKYRTDCAGINREIGQHFMACEYEREALVHAAYAAELRATAAAKRIEAQVLVLNARAA